MTNGKLQDDATLLDVLIDGFEKNEVMHGFHWRQVPMPNEGAAALKFASLAAEAQRWKGTPLRTEERSGRRLAAWSDLEIRQAGCGIVVRVKAPWFSSWWHEPKTWSGDPVAQIFEWIEEEAAQNLGRSG